MSLIIDLKVIPGAKHNKIILDAAGRIVCYVKSVAQDNKANDELIKNLAASLKIPKFSIMIIGGHKTRNKRIMLNEKDLTLDIVLDKLGLEKPSLNMKIW